MLKGPRAPVVPSFRRWDWGGCQEGPVIPNLSRYDWSPRATKNHLSGWCGSSHPVSGCDRGTPTSSMDRTPTCDCWWDWTGFHRNGQTSVHFRGCPKTLWLTNMEVDNGHLEDYFPRPTASAIHFHVMCSSECMFIPYIDQLCRAFRETLRGLLASGETPAFRGFGRRLTGDQMQKS